MAGSHDGRFVATERAHAPNASRWRDRRASCAERIALKVSLNWARRGLGSAVQSTWSACAGEVAEHDRNPSGICSNFTPQVFIVPGFTTVGALIVARRANMVGWLFIGLGLLAASHGPSHGL